MEQDQLDKIIEQNPGIDPTAIERSREIERRLAAVGIKLGGYRLSPPLGGPPLDFPGVFNQKLR